MKKISLSLSLLWVTTICTAQKFGPTVTPFISINQDSFVLTHVKIIDGSGGPSKQDQTLVVTNGKFELIGDNGSFNFPTSAKIINCTGKTIIPGMVMMHEHMFYGESQPPVYLGQAMPLSFPKLYLAGGATTIRTAGTTEPQTDLNVKRWIMEGRMLGPDMDVTAPYIEREGIPIPEILFIKNTEEAKKEASRVGG